MAIFDDLPVELAQYIWSLLEDDPAGKRHVCTAVVPVVRRHAVEQTRLESQKDVDDFASLVMRVDPLHRRLKGVMDFPDYVRDLDLPRIVDMDVDFDELAANPDDAKKVLDAVCKTRDEALKTSARFVEVLYRCHQVTSLECTGVAALAVVLRTQAYPRMVLTKLGTLAVHDVSSRSLFPMSDLERLRRLPTLRRLTVVARDRDRNAFAEFERPALSVDGPSPVESLYLTAGESLATPGAALFVADFGRLARLELTLRAVVDVGTFLQACPATLSILLIRFDGYEGQLEIDPLNVEADLARFVNLQHLLLGANTYSPTCELFPILSANLPRLRTLHLMHKTALVADKLLDYVVARGGPSRQLDKLVLNSIDYDADPLPSHEPDYADVASGMLDLDLFWVPPAWTPSFTLNDARALIAAAEHADVELDGSTVGAVEYDVVRAREEKYLLERRDEVLEAVRGLFGVGDDDGEV